MLSSLLRFGFQKKTFATLTPREQILSSLSKLELISKSKTDAELDIALKASNVDATSLPDDVKTYVSRTVSSGTASFTKDPKAWYNKQFGDYVVEEVTRKEATPFFAGGLVCFLLFCIWLPSSLTKEGSSNSTYIHLIEGHNAHADEKHH